MKRRRNLLIWIGVATTFAGAVSYFTVFARFPAVRDFPWVNLPVVLLGVALSAVAVVRPFRRPERYRGKILGSFGVIASTLIAAAFVGYVFWFSYTVPEPTEVAVSLGVAPDLTLTDRFGEPVRLHDHLGRKVVIVFYRGFW